MHLDPRFLTRSSAAGQGWARWAASGFLLLALGCNSSVDDTPAPAPVSPSAAAQAPLAVEPAKAEAEIPVPAQNAVAAAPTMRPLVIGDVPVEVASAAGLPNLSPESKSLLRVRQKLDETIWANEVAAQEHEQTFVVLWDRLREAQDKFKALTEFPFETLIVGQPGESRELDWGIRHTHLAAQGANGEAAREIRRDQLPALLAELAGEGYRLVELEFHHSKFDPAVAGKPARSVFASVFHVTNEAQDRRLIIKGDLVVDWTGQRDQAGNPIAARLDATNFQMLERQGKPPFEEMAAWEFPTDPAGKKAPSTTHPILVYDLDGDGLSEIVMGGFNQVYRNRGEGKFEREQFCAHPPRHPNGGVIADFNGDGQIDYFCGVKNGYPQLYFGDERGQFTAAPREIRTALPLRSPTTITAGDIDGDSDLDLWVGQYKPPYLNGHMPTPYYDANDGFPGFLLVNDGQGNFTDRTEEAGLAPKRFRRNYSSSFVDLNNDDKLDLIVVSDFAGIDVYYGDGQGKFTDVTEEVTPAKYAFGMSHTFGDYNLDGLLDFYVIGMSSTTARRLEYMNLKRHDFSDRTQARSQMGYGNRMYLSTGDGFVQAPFMDQVARSGWSWGSTTFDPDNDGDGDLFVANGYQSGKSCKDYCTRYWTHDVYTGSSEPDPAIKELFGQSLGDLNQLEISWNGFEHDVLFMNLGGEEFVNIGFLMGVGFEFDSRSVVSDDLDGDGKVDLLVEQFERADETYTLHLLKNNWPSEHHWIGVRLREHGQGISPLGAKLVLTYPGGKRIAQNVSGHSVWSQHPNTVHWGLGDASAVESIEVRWPNGQTSRLENPAVDQYHTVEPPKG